MKEDTILDQDEHTVFDEPTKKQDTHPEGMETVDNQANASKGNGTWKKVGIGAATGLMFGGSAAFFSSAAANGNGESPDANSNLTHTTESAPVVDEEISMATGVTDDMSFSEAFAAARAEVGSGGVFEWHGNLYNTYTASEWDSMSAEARDEYGSHFASAQSENHTNSQSQQPATAANDEAEVVGHEPANQQANVHTASQEPSDNGGSAEVVAVDETNVQVLGVTHDEETGANIGAMTVDGQEVFLIDVNNDEVFDYMASDLNNDGQLTDNEVADISGANVTVNDLGGMTTPGNDVYYASTDDVDYINNADAGLYDA